MPPHKMIPPLPASLAESESDRFKNFAKAILAVPKSKIATPEHGKQNVRHVIANLQIHREVLVERLPESILQPKQPPPKTKSSKIR
jgi:hypothetical protein